MELPFEFDASNASIQPAMRLDLSTRYACPVPVGGEKEKLPRAPVLPPPPHPVQELGERGKCASFPR